MSKTKTPMEFDHRLEAAKMLQTDGVRITKLRAALIKIFNQHSKDSESLDEFKYIVLSALREDDELGGAEGV